MADTYSNIYSKYIRKNKNRHLKPIHHRYHHHHHQHKLTATTTTTTKSELSISSNLYKFYTKLPSTVIDSNCDNNKKLATNNNNTNANNIDCIVVLDNKTNEICTTAALLTHTNDTKPNCNDESVDSSCLLDKDDNNNPQHQQQQQQQQQNDENTNQQEDNVDEKARQENNKKPTTSTSTTKYNLKSSPVYIINKCLINLLQNKFALVFVLILCLVPILIKIAPLRYIKHSPINIKPTTTQTTPSFNAQQFQQQQLQVKNESIISSTSSSSSSSILNTITSTKSRPVIQHKAERISFVDIFISRLKDERLRTYLAKQTCRLKSLCSGKYVAIRKHTIVAKADEEKAFTSKYAIIQIIRLGTYAVLYNQHLDLYICYDNTGNLKPMKLSELSELCVFRMSIKHGIDSYREFISVSKQYASSTVQFKDDGNDLNAKQSTFMNVALNESLTLYSSIINNKRICPQYTGLLLHVTQLDDIKQLERIIKDESPNMVAIREKFFIERQQFILNRNRKTTDKLLSQLTTTTTNRLASTRRQNRISQATRRTWPYSRNLNYPIVFQQREQQPPSQQAKIIT